MFRVRGLLGSRSLRFEWLPWRDTGGRVAELGSSTGIGGIGITGGLDSDALTAVEPAPGGFDMADGVP